MNRKTHQTEEAFDELCRDIVGVVRASEDEIQAAANAPFLYQRLRAQIAAEQIPIATIVPPRRSKLNFAAALGAWQTRWRWAFALATVGVVILALTGWRWLMPDSSAPAVVRQDNSIPMLPPSPVVTPTPNEAQRNQEQELATATRKPDQATPTKAKPVRKPLRATERFAAETIAEETEIATEFMPLTYAGNRDENSGHIVRMEVPREALIALGIPMAKELTSERIKADVKVGDDGVALAIRLISNDNE